MHRHRVGTNSGMDYWNGTLDWTTGLSYFPFLDKFLNSFLEAHTFYDLQVYLATMDDCNNENSCLLQCSHKQINKSKYTLEDTVYCKLLKVEKFSGFWWIDWQPCENFPA